MAVTISLGTAGMALVFSDGARTLVYDSAVSAAKIGAQQITATPAHVTAAAQALTLPTGADPAASGQVVLNNHGSIVLQGKATVSGANDVEHVTFLGGNVVLDASFKRGGDTLFLSGKASTFSAHVAGSSVVFDSAVGEITVPVGTAGMTLDFPGDSRTLLFDAASNHVLLGTQVLTASTVVLG